LERERAVLCLVAQGHSNHEIAQPIFLAEETAKNNVTTLPHKIGLRDRTQAALWARKLGLL
jgi:DNA-binding NarL/FixJ family response regulator